MTSRGRSASTGADVLAEAVSDALASSGTFHRLHPPEYGVERNPRRLTIRNEDLTSVDVWVCMCQLADHGDRKFRRNKEPAALNELGKLSEAAAADQGGPAVMLAYEPNSKIFLGWVPKRRRDRRSLIEERPAFATLLFDEDMPVETRLNGLSFRRSTAGTLLVGVRPDHVGVYVRYAEAIHRDGGTGKIFRVLEHIGRGRWQDADAMLPPGTPAWLFALTETNNRWTFKDRVRAAYGNTCVLSGMQLGLLDSAHIYEKSRTDTSHLVCNGFLLQPTLHRAHDDGLIYLVVDEHGIYQFHRNEVAMRRAELDYGREGRKDIERYLNKPLDGIPKEKHLRPGLWWMRMSYRYRGIMLMRRLWTTDTEEEKWRREKRLIK